MKKLILLIFLLSSCSYKNTPKSDIIRENQMLRYENKELQKITKQVSEYHVWTVNHYQVLINDLRKKLK